jgi:adenine phosphoribosyltransferase
MSKFAHLIRDIPDFPKPGVMFKDITGLLGDPVAMCALADALTDPWRSSDTSNAITKVAGVEARGFLLAPLVAERLGVGLIPIRKPGKLPAETISRSYALEYGEDRIEVHQDAATAKDRVLVIDDVLATGGTGHAAVQLMTDLGATVVGFAVVIELVFLGGRARFGESTKITSLIQVD